jgi:hypothetical protein
MFFSQTSFSRAFKLLAVLTVAWAAGCGRQNADDSVNKILKETGQQRADVFPLAGKVMVDGHAPQTRPGGGKRLIVILSDPAKPDAPVSSRPKATCQPNGDFAFNMYGTGDGVVAGKYVVVLVELKFDKRKGYVGPDGLKNLYNDPDKNATVDGFVIEHKAPGKKDYVFNLEVEGHEPGTPGPHSITTFR